jgi:hypothetical protein
MSDGDKALTLTLRTVADLSGAQQLDAGLQKTAQTAKAADEAVRNQAGGLELLKAAFNEQIEMAGLSAAATEKAKAAIDQMVQAMDQAEQQGLSKALDFDALMSLDGLQNAQQELNALIETERRAEAQTEKFNETITKTSEAYAKVGHKEQIEGLGGVAKEVTRAGTGMRITAEKAVMMGQAVAGLTSQVVAGADSTQLLASGATNLAMILSTGGPLGMAAGFVVQMMSTFTLQLSKANEAASKAAEEGFKELTSQIEATIDQIKNLNGAGATSALERHAKAINALSDGWKKARSDSEAYYRVQDSKADAEKERAQAALELQRQQALDTARDEFDRDRINREFDRRSSEIDNDAGIAKADREAQRLDTEAKMNARAIEEATAAMRNLEDQYREIQGERVRPQGVTSDQQASIDSYREALIREQRGLGDSEQNMRIIREIQPQLENLRAIIDARQETYNSAKKDGTSQEKEAVALAETQRKANEEALKKLREEIAALKKERDEAWEREKQLKVDAENNRARRDALIDRSSADYLDMQRDYREIDSREAEHKSKEEGDAQKKAERDASKSLKAAEGKLKGTEKAIDKQADELQEKIEQMADQVRGADAELAKGFDGLAKTLKDGASAEEVHRIAEVVQGFTQTSNAAFNALSTAVVNLSQSTLAALQQAEAAKAAVEKLRTQVRP